MYRKDINKLQQVQVRATNRVRVLEHMMYSARLSRLGLLDKTRLWGVTDVHNCFLHQKMKKRQASWKHY